MIVTEYRTRLKDKRHLGGGTTAFYFEKPLGFEFKAGHYVDITLINPPETDPDGNIRSFSIASSPSEDHLLIITRMRGSAFKRSLQDLPYDTEVELEGPFGSFTLHANPLRPAVFLAGGIGITPFLSMVLSTGKKKLAHDSYLFYTNARPEETSFLNDLQNLEKRSLNFRFIPTMMRWANHMSRGQGKRASSVQKCCQSTCPGLKVRFTTSRDRHTSWPPC